ncbi:FAD-binding oxidoreductase [Nocardioides sp. YIM 152315]|uniref:NAD(P)/FAD-dependent oxidoreductase n=1 Tax=Nocardioides sp. YIM 152315 TaxID=3031760 RepID=UPI0023DC9B63|nr:FAD-binding oxidoreductase [Nocardioides sp. YIM 152315]MDF1602788.1 FAD-binding oxidoreductase [Nocardioides sp. YIM 152315]
MVGVDPHYERLSLWHDTVETDWTPRAPLDGDAEADVAIVGAGLTGLWAAHYLAAADPELRIVVLEAETAGFGASGRNGGWCSALFPASLDTLAGYADRAAALAQHRAMRETVDEVARVAAAEGIDAQVAKGGTITLARSRAQWARARAEVAEARTWDRGDDDLRLLDQEEAQEILRGSRTRGATYTPDCAALHPARLVRGLADAVERRGVTIHERTRVSSIEPRRVRTDQGVVAARTILRATEGYTSSLRGERRTMVPVYSLIIATQPLAPEVWDEIGLARRETFTDHRHLIVYGQRTADDRLVFGGRGAPYHLGSRIRPEHDRDEKVFASLYSTLVDLFPVLAGARVSHAWGGALGIPRDWCASVGLNRSTGIGWAGGYVGDGVSTTNLAGRTLRDLVLGRDTELTRLPWVGHLSPLWEPEPLRWLGINAGLRAMTLADAEERVTRLPSLVARAVSPLLG